MLLFLAAIMTKKNSVNQTKQSTIFCVDSNHRMKVQTVAFAVVTQTGRVLNGQNVSPFNQTCGSRSCRCGHFVRSDTRIA